MTEPTKTRTSISNTPSRQDQAELAKEVGARLKEAREMVGLSQLVAAKNIGYSNSTKLSKIETGKHSSQIPMWVLKRAAQVYDVSLDYLLGVTESMERDDLGHHIYREMATHMREEWNRYRHRDIIVQSSMIERVKCIEGSVSHIGTEAEQAEKAMIRLVELNSKLWDKMRGGHKALASVQATAAAARTANQKMKRFRNENRASGGTPQLDLVFI